MAKQERTGMDLEQRRAAYAWESALECQNADYANLAKSAPALIMNNGLMQTLAFYESKSKNHHKALSRHICAWLSLRGFSNSKSGAFREIMSDLFNSKSADYRRATEEALALLRWIRQFASALVSKD